MQPDCIKRVADLTNEILPRPVWFLSYEDVGKDAEGEFVEWTKRNIMADVTSKTATPGRYWGGRLICYVTGDDDMVFLRIVWG